MGLGKLLGFILMVSCFLFNPKAFAEPKEVARIYMPYQELIGGGIPGNYASSYGISNYFVLEVEGRFFLSQDVQADARNSKPKLWRFIQEFSNLDQIKVFLNSDGRPLFRYAGEMYYYDDDASAGGVPKEVSGISGPVLLISERSPAEIINQIQTNSLEANPERIFRRALVKNTALHILYTGGVFGCIGGLIYLVHSLAH